MGRDKKERGDTDDKLRGRPTSPYFERSSEKFTRKGRPNPVAWESPPRGSPGDSPSPCFSDIEKNHNYQNEPSPKKSKSSMNVHYYDER